MEDSRSKRAKLNIIVSLGCQVITIICGLIIPKLMLESFGAEIYGATASISQFLSYITLLEGGIGGVARAVLYKPLADKDNEKISAIVKEMDSFFRIIAFIFVIYTLILACLYKQISGLEILDWLSSFLLVIVISFSTFAQYFIGISYSTLIQAAQKYYLVNILSVVTIIINTILVVILVSFNCNIILVKLLSSLLFAVRPICLRLYTKKHFNLNKTGKSDKKYLEQKWDGLGQHISYYLHSNTDIVVLTLFSNLTNVSIYSLYNMITSNMQNLTMSFISGMEALFGDMLAKKEYDKLNHTFDSYEMLLSVVTVVLFSVTGVLIVPFINIYTSKIEGNFIAPVFALLLVINVIVYCLRLPYHSIVIAAGHFKETKIIAYSEAIINIVLSIVFVKVYGLIGVTLATVIATTIRFIYYVFYLSKNIFFRKKIYATKRILVNSTILIVNYIICMGIINQIEILSYLSWAVCGVVCVVICLIITIIFNCLFYKKLSNEFINKLLKK